MSYFSVDVEADGPFVPEYSMVCFGVVKIADLTKTYHGLTFPITDKYDAESLAISGYTREDHEHFPHPSQTMPQFVSWLKQANTDGRPVFTSDNPAFDWMWMNYYLWFFTGSNPFGFSARRIGDLYCGLVKDAGKNGEWKKKYRKTKHTHNPVDDAMGNAEALLTMRDAHGLRIVF